ncbi:sigma-70 family RNA polymerase sigma factor [bacterium]|nr:sigma-70 family RNA polymerase sigma factor [candidate division CSSED10-310 bacterium]
MANDARCMDRSSGGAPGSNRMGGDGVRSREAEPIARILNGIRRDLDQGREPDLEAAAETLFGLLRGWINLWLRRYPLAEEDREELVMEVFYNIFNYKIRRPVMEELAARLEHREALDDAFEALPVPVLMCITKNNCLQQYLRLKRRRRPVEIPLDSLRARPEEYRNPVDDTIAADDGLVHRADPIDSMEGGEQVRKWLRQLKARDRCIVALSFYYNCSDADIAEELVQRGLTRSAMSSVNIRQCRHRSLRRLRDYLIKTGQADSRGERN